LIDEVLVSLLAAELEYKVMKEIDFLPMWYKSHRRQQRSYRLQYISIAVVFAIMMFWNFLAGRTVSKMATEFTEAMGEQNKAEAISAEFAKIKVKVSQLQQKADMVKKIIPKSSIKVSNVLGEMSYLIGERIVFSQVQLLAQKIATQEASKPRNIKERIASGDVKFKILMEGVAADAADFAELVCDLEESAYFCQINPSLERNKTIKAAVGLTGRQTRVTEFKISCYLANYQREVFSLLGAVQNKKKASGI